MTERGLEKPETERGWGSERPKGHHGDKDEVEIRGQERESNVTLVVYYLSRWYYNVRCAEYERWHFYVWSNKKWWGQTRRNRQNIQPLSLSNSFPPDIIPPSLSPLLVFLSSSAQLTSSPLTLLLFFFIDLSQETHSNKTLRLLFDPPLSPSVSHVISPPRDHICVTLSSLSLSLSILPYLHGFSCL